MLIYAIMRLFIFFVWFVFMLLEFFDALPCAIDEYLNKCYNSSFPKPINGSRVNAICRYAYQRGTLVSWYDGVRIAFTCVCPSVCLLVCLHDKQGSYRSWKSMESPGI